MLKNPIVKALLYHHPDNTYKFKAKGIESTSSKYDYLINKTGLNCRKYFQRRALSKHLYQLQEKARYYQTIGDKSAYEKALRKFRHLEIHGINKIIESTPQHLNHRPALQSLMISLGYDVEDPDFMARHLFFLWCEAYQQKTMEWEYYGVYHRDTDNPHFHLVVYESQLKREKYRFKANTLYRQFSKPKLKRFKELVGCTTESQKFDGLEIKIETVKQLHTMVMKLDSVKEQRDRNLLKVFLNFIGMQINQLKTYDPIYTNLCHNKRDDLILPQSIRRSKYFEDYLIIRPDALTCTVGIIKKEYKRLKLLEYIKEMQIYLEAIKKVNFNENLYIYCQQIEVEFQKILNQLSQRIDSYETNQLAQNLQKIETAIGDKIVNNEQLEKLFGYDKKLIKPVDWTKMRRTVKIV